MNYGKKATEKKLRDTASSSRRYASKFFLGFFKTLLLSFILIIAVGVSVGVGMIKGIIDSAPEINLYMEYRGRVCLETVLKFYREFNLKLLNMEITRHADSDSSTSCAIFTLRLNKKCSAEWVVAQLHGVKGINIVEEM